MSTAPSEESNVVAPRPGRWLALDLFRFCAVCLMVQGHVFSTLLDQATKHQRWYPHHSFVHGYTAPMFLFGAGLAFGYTTFRGWSQHTSGGAAALKRWKRYGWLLLIGYGLHLPTLSLRGLLALDDAEQIRRMLQVDVLQHIGVSLAICQLLVMIVKRQRVFVGIVLAFATISIFAAPWVWNVDLSGSAVPAWLAGYVNASTGSIFPLLPWAGFTYLGIVVAYAVTNGSGAPSISTQSISARASWPFAALAALFLIVPILIDRLGVWPWPEHNFWKTNPLFFFWRLGNILAVLALLCFVERALENWRLLRATASTRATRVTQRALAWAKLIGAESLIIYVVHLVVLHGSVLGRGLKSTTMFHSESLGLPMTSAVAIVLLLAMVLLAKAWSDLREMKLGFRTVQLSMTTVFAYLMLTH